jgi:hypothetical protein
MHGHVMQGHVMHSHAVHCILHVRIISDMQTVAIGPKTVLTAACLHNCFKFSTTAKFGMSLKINSAKPTTANS